jgi:hypothetical protein
VGRASASTSAKDRRMEEIFLPVPQFHTQVVRLSYGDLKFYDRELHRDVVRVDGPRVHLVMFGHMPLVWHVIASRLLTIQSDCKIEQTHGPAAGGSFSARRAMNFFICSCICSLDFSLRCSLICFLITFIVSWDFRILLLRISCFL